MPQLTFRPGNGDGLPGPRCTETGDDGRAGKPRRPTASGRARPEKTPGLALPADLGRSLRLLDGDALDRLVKAAIEEAKRRGRDVPQGSVEEHQQSELSGPAKGRSKKAAPFDRADVVTPGQERLIP